ncbi:uncharacterized protein LOC127004258 isoform X1 [Eriocheir sinensis]|uniref:uncharacterized protein LOC127004258 isoform X1 n=1 Tax=Eriocheir sinensis TaxID=95602 RepID=UPI0021C80D85|nr:uncharacterized protein LOC127004258 isoform X1 [Eriocheir sinensis]XP_050727780.1 uncharacterized protein LOC127004258 isoform X1 [Eriocheir sinensis]XP_050727781.1 uncharacterized protein LOC127004258 isoform X1 [Eriocheir sinensis]XP_050727782.1 uncharacterized protein LOC127004258 isoform X1 [Eriocheir sinensis]
MDDFLMLEVHSLTPRPARHDLPRHQLSGGTARHFLKKALLPLTGWCDSLLLLGWCSSAGRCHNTGHSSPQQQSLHRQVILHQQAFQQLGEIDTTKRRRGGGGGLGRRRGTQEEPIECVVSRRQADRDASHSILPREGSRVSQL